MDPERVPPLRVKSSVFRFPVRFSTPEKENGMLPVTEPVLLPVMSQVLAALAARTVSLPPPPSRDMIFPDPVAWISMISSLSPESISTSVEVPIRVIVSFPPSVLRVMVLMP